MVVAAVVGMFTRTIATSLYALVTLALVAAAPACSSAEASDAESSENAITEGEGSVKSGTTTAFAGDFSVRVDHLIKVEFSVTNIDWRALSATWNAKIVARDGAPVAVNHVNVDVPMKIALARCPGCFTLTAQEENAGELVRLDFTNGALAAINYVDYDAISPKITSAGDGRTGGASCTLSCEGNELECSEGGTEQTCDASRFAALPRCLYQVAFAAKSCTARSEAPTKGSCSLVCGGSATDCKTGVTEAECNASIFDSVPRCPHTFNFAAGGTCR